MSSETSETSSSDGREINRRQALRRSALGVGAAGVGWRAQAGEKQDAAAVGQDAPAVAAGNTGGPVSVQMSGQMGSQRQTAGWPNLVQIADLALGHFNQICDPDRHYVPYIGGSLGWRKPSFNHHRYDWIEVLPYPLLGRIVARRLTGNLAGQEIEVRQRQLLLSSFHNLDGFAHPQQVQSWGGGTELDLWEQGRVMYALLAWYLDSQDERLLGYLRGMVRALYQISHRAGRGRSISLDHPAQIAFGPLSAVSLVECLTKYHQISGDGDALQLAGGLIDGILDPGVQFTDGQGRLSGFLRGNVSTIACLARYAAYTNDERLLDQAERLFRSAHALISRSGATPEEEPCCTLMEMTTAALVLTAAGRGSWWDLIDRYFRNQLVASQFRDPDSVAVGSIPDQPRPEDDTRDILRRAVGGFSWASPYEFLHWDRRLMLCCGGHAIWTLGKIVEHAVSAEEDGLAVHLHFNLETPLASVTSWEPFQGRLEVVPRRSGKVRIRQPSYATRIAATVAGAPVEPQRQGDYVVFSRVAAGTEIALTFPLPTTTTEEIVKLPQAAGGGVGEWLGPKADPIVGYRVPTRWCGNTVLGIDRPSASAVSARRIPGWQSQPQHGLYLNRAADLARGPTKQEAAFFLPERSFVW